MQKIMGSSLRLTTSTIICNPLPTYLGKGLCVVVLVSLVVNLREFFVPVIFRIVPGFHLQNMTRGAKQDFKNWGEGEKFSACGTLGGLGAPPQRI